MQHTATKNTVLKTRKTADDVSGNGNSDEPLVISTPVSHDVEAVSAFEDAMEETFRAKAEDFIENHLHSRRKDLGL
jgi:hypothetical protein